MEPDVVAVIELLDDDDESPPSVPSSPQNDWETLLGADLGEEEEDFSSPKKTLASRLNTAATAPRVSDDVPFSLGEEEEELLTNLFPGEAEKKRPDLTSSTSSSNIAPTMLKRKATRREGEAEGGGRTEGMLKLRKTRSVERLHPKLKPLKILGAPEPVPLPSRSGRRRKGRNGRAEDGEEKGRDEEGEQEEVDGEECPLCGVCFAADLLEAHVESELDQQKRQQQQLGLLATSGEEGPSVLLLEEGGGSERPLTGECPFCRRHFRCGPELESHVSLEMAACERAGGGEERIPTTSTATTTNATATTQKRARLPCSFSLPNCASKPLKRPPTWQTQPGAIIVGDSQPAASHRTREADANSDEDNYDDVTFNFRPIWDASQGLRYDFENQFVRQKQTKRGGRSKSSQVGDVDMDMEEDEGGTAKRSRGGGSKRGAFSRSGVKGAATKRRGSSGWRERRGRGKRGR